MLKPIIISFALLFLATSANAEEEPTMHEVYLAAKAGKFAEAQSMMDKVLHAHPNSAKAHFVEAELLAKQGLLTKAADELITAERLKPGLPFANPDAVKNLKSLVSSSTNTAVQPNIASVQNAMPASIKDWMPWILLILGIGLIILLIGFFTRRNTNMLPANNYGNSGFGTNQPYVGPNGTGPVMGQPAVGGMGSSLMSSLATGAALGAGVVAGEALMHHILDDDKNQDKIIHEPPHHDPSPWTTASNINESDDMGGLDFGITDASSWEDDVSSDGGDEWT